MSDADVLNDTLARELPAAWRCLSPLGRAAAFPRGIPFQAGEAKGSRIDATIGQMTDGRGAPLPLGPLSGLVGDLDDRTTWLYAPVEGPKGLRDKWGARERRLAGSPTVAASTPFVTHGLTHGLSLVADLFADPETDIVLPSPSWENYGLVFSMHAGARTVDFPYFQGDRFNVQGLADALTRVRSCGIVVLNFPGNPTGYQPDPDEVRQIVDVLTSHPGPLVAVVDDAYQGFLYDGGRHARSLFWDLCERADLDRLLPVKIDGATKELVFFSSRVGFLTHAPGSSAAEAAMLSKLKFLVRGTVGCASGPALAMVDAALAHPDLDAAFEERRQLLSRRWAALRRGLEAIDNPRVRPRPFHGAFFGLLELSGGLEAEALRKRLLAEKSVGTIAFPEDNALRVAYCSIHEDDVPELCDAIRSVVG